jgi:hypothetical protein
MGNCTGIIKKKHTRPYGRANIVRIALSASYATGGDTVPASILGIGNRLSALLVSGSTSPGGHAIEVLYGANEYAAAKLRIRDAATGTEIANATDLSAQSVYAEAIASPYK